MLYAGHYLFIRFILLSRSALIAIDHCFGNAGSKIRVLAVAFADSTPARIPGYVQHRTECPADSVRTCFYGRYVSRLFHRLHIPGTGESERYREYGFVTVDYVHSEQERDAEA